MLRKKLKEIINIYIHSFVLSQCSKEICNFINEYLGIDYWSSNEDYSYRGNDIEVIFHFDGINVSSAYSERQGIFTDIAVYPERAISLVRFTFPDTRFFLDQAFWGDKYRLYIYREATYTASCESAMITPLSEFLDELSDCRISMMIHAFKEKIMYRSHGIWNFLQN